MKKIHTFYILMSMLFFFTASHAQATEITNYVNGQTFDSTYVTLDLEQNAGSDFSYFRVRTSPIITMDNICFKTLSGSTTSQMLGILPDNGMDIHIEIITSVDDSSKYYYDYFNFKTPKRVDLPAGANMTAPINNSTFDSTTVTFEWEDIGASQYWLDIGTAPGLADILSDQVGYSIQPDFTASATVLELPGDGLPLYVRLWSQIGNDWVFTDTTYTAYTDGFSPAQMISPVPDSRLDSTTVTFEWDAVSGAEDYRIYVGSVRGSRDLVYTSSIGLVTSYTVDDLYDNGHKVYVRLWTQVGGVWKYVDHMYLGYSTAL